ncbi:acyl-CoA dehydrogenase family protein [Candidatus Poriferisocius sp.]|uniref:acyl-CoA dehydrogenase family protein n=1 Tax=Candidatus Poriferisocius sp. TaxID=3101276 RepID=UPI003B013DA7
MDFALSPDLLELRDRARAVAAEGVARFGRHNDSWINGYSKEFAQVMAGEGWIGMGWPKEYGGQARPPIERLIVAEEMITAGAPVAAMWFADRQMGPTLIAYGTEQQKAAYLPKMLSGEATWCIGMSEPDAGSDLVSISTRAVRDGSDFVIEGRKIWTSFGHVADYCYLICRTGDDGPPHRGISEIVVPMDSPGIEVHPITDMISNRHFCEIFFTGVRVPAGNLVGTEGDAFKQTMAQLAHERGGIDRLVSNRALFHHACARADRQDRRVRQQIARLESEYRVGRLLVYREAMGQAPTNFSAATKAFCTEHEQRVARFAATQLGPDALLDSPWTRGICYSPGYTIMGGTSNVMRNILGERVLGLPSAPRLPTAKTP